jgi:hypothetical protein
VTRFAGVYSSYILFEFPFSSLSGVLLIRPAYIGGEPPRPTTFFRGQLIGVCYDSRITTEDIRVFKGLGCTVQKFLLGIAHAKCSEASTRSNQHEIVTE